jgi:DNA polymerase I
MYWLAAPHRQLLWHNAKHDLRQFDYAARGLLRPHPCPADGEPRYRHLTDQLLDNTVWDTMIAQKVMEGSTSAGLKPTAERLWGPESVRSEQAIEDWFKKNRMMTKPDRFARLPWELVEPYARQDVRLTYRLFEHQQAALEEDSDLRTERLIEREMAFMRVLYRMEQRGIGFDSESSKEAETALRAEMAELARRLPFRPTLPAAKKYYYEELKYAPRNLTKKGAPSLAERDLETLAEAEAPFADVLLRHEALKSAVGKWYGAWPRLVGEDGRLRPIFSQTSVRSMRLSATRVQLHAIPHERHFKALGLDRLGVVQPRELFQAKPRHELWEVDLSQGEVRIAAAVAQCKAMREIVSTSSDVHGDTAKRVFKIDETAPDWKSKRDIAKRITFGTIYGAGARTLAETIFKETGIRIPESDMFAMVDMYKATFPEFYRFAREQQLLLEERGYVTLISGKRRYFNFGNPLWENPKDAFNAVIQGGLAEVMRDAMIRVEQELPGTLLLQVHDSLLAEFPKKTAERQAEEIRQILIYEYEKAFKIPFNADAARWKDKK